MEANQQRMTYDQFDDDLEEWIEDDGVEDDVLACPSCHQAVHEDTQQCPHCGDWIVPIDPRDKSRRSIWLVVVVLLVIALTMWTVF